MKRLLPWTLLGTLGTWNADPARAAGRYYAGGRSKQVLTTFTVTNLLDDGAGSLRDAIAQANANPGLDTIQFDVTGLLPVGLPLAITDAVTIVGPGADQLELDGGNLDRVFEIFDPDVTTNGNPIDVFPASISGLTISNGQAPYYDYNDTRYFYDAGGILALEVDLTLDDVTFRNNYGAIGGAVYFRADLVGPGPEPAGITVSDCRFEQNTAIGAGGGMIIADASRDVVVARSTFSGNVSLIGLPEGARHASSRLRWRDQDHLDALPTPLGLVGLIPGGGGFSSGDLDHEVALIDNVFEQNSGYLGGAIRSSAADGGGIRLERSTLHDNFALLGGGIGSFYIAETSQMHVFNSTISGNDSLIGPAFTGIFIYPGSNERKLIFDHTTITENLAYIEPGAVYLYDARPDGATPTVLFNNTAIINNAPLAVRQTPTAPDGAEASTADLKIGLDVAIEANFSAFADVNSAGRIDVGSNNLFAPAGTLSPLLDATDSTPVHLPMQDSALRNAASLAPSAFVVDQRGLARVAGGRADIGAVEADALGGSPEFDSTPVVPATLFFRPLEFGISEQTVLIRNYGGATLDLQIPSLTAPFETSFSGPVSLAPGESINLTVGCAPVTNGGVMVDWVITSNDADEASAALQLDCGTVGSAHPVPVFASQPWQVLAAILMALAGFRYGPWRRDLGAARKQ
ncbi:hypothetical protein C7S18_14775 [Ahniella affigens]|uniref:Abnormal spindle-like microcephaly-associated protein ASH domain-containing protein n=1 Tax=Ahniella affigens TaxID=2021234 RepID=A0A2P1PU77_9GAMM|nr:right-handed parallel beta-helix repeat-containing protein [Ahniella affigens]AVP98372.1 hypothetical protein C7S18_14775 [Ahniella affigens]